MGWGDCGDDRKGRPIGYAFEATCDHPGCEATIDRGLAYACGGEHGEGDYYCEGYFCGDHLSYEALADGELRRICPACRAAVPALAAEQGFVECNNCGGWVASVNGDGECTGCVERDARLVVAAP